MLFRQLLDTLGIDSRSRAFHLDLGRRREEVAASDQPRSPRRPGNLGPYRPTGRFVRHADVEAHARRITQTCRRLLEEGDRAGRDRLRPGAADEPRRSASSSPGRRRRATCLERPVLRQPDQVSVARTSAAGQAGDLVKGCDERALVVLEKESQIDRSQIVVIGMACDGVGQPRAGRSASACDVHHAAGRRYRDWPSGRPANEPPTGRAAATPALEAFLQKTPAERMAYWTAELSPLREVLRLPAGLPAVLLPAVHRRQESARGDRHLGHAQGQFRLADHAGVPPRRPLRGLRRVYAGLPGRHRPAAAEPVAGQGGRREFRLSRRHGPGRRTDRRRLLRARPARSSSDERSFSPDALCADWSRRWIAAGKRVAGPQRVKPRRLPSRWLDSIRLARTRPSSLLLDGFIRPANSIKEFVFPRHEKLYGYRFQGKQIELRRAELPDGRADHRRRPALRRRGAADPRPCVQLGLRATSSTTAAAS